MKRLLAGLITLTVAACGGNSSSGKKQPAPTKQGDVEGVPVVENNGPLPEAPVSKSPAVCVYLGSCETLGSIGIESGIEIKATAVLPVTVVFGDKSCAKESLATFGYTGNFESFAAYAEYIQATSKAAGDPVSASFLDTLITFASENGHKLSLVKRDVTLPTEKRLTLTLFEEKVDTTAKTVSASVRMKNSVFAANQWELAFYCEKEGKLVRQESTFTTNNGAVLINAKLNSWAPNTVSFPTRCQAAFTLIHGEKGQERTDIAYSQFLNVP